MGLFGPNEVEISWKRFAVEVGGEFHDTRWQLGSPYQVLVYVEPWTIELDMICSSGPGGGGILTVMRAPYISNDGFTLKIYPKRISTLLFKLTLGKLFGMQYIEVGDPEFDREFLIKCRETSKAQALLGNTKIRQLIQSVMPRSGCLEATSQKLSYEEQTNTFITDVVRLKSILELLIETLNQMREIGSASPLPPSEKR